jgi:CysZ protein
MVFNQFLSAFFNYFRAIGFLIKHKFWKYIVIPGLLSVIIIMLIISVVLVYATDVSAFLVETLVHEGAPNAFLKFLLDIFVAVALIVLALLIYRPLALITLAPFLSTLSEKTESLISSADALSSASFFKDLQRSIRINLRYFLFSSFYSLAAIATGIVPVAGTIISTVILFFIQAYYGGCGLADIILERRGLNVAQRLQYIKVNKSTILGTGTGFLLILLLPVIGWFIAPGLGIIAATFSISKIENQHYPPAKY